MPTFPIPVFVACVLAFSSLRLWHQQGRSSRLALLLVLCAVQSLVIALVQHYGFTGMRSVQPILASLIPPAAWIVFRARGTVLLHLVGPLAVAAALVFAPQLLDVILPTLFVAYGSAILYRAKDGADAQPYALLSSGDLPARIWFVIGATLIGAAVSDLLIITTQIAGYASLRPWIISFFSVGNLLIIGVLSLSPHLQTQIEETLPEVAQEPSAEPTPDPQIWDQIQAYMAAQKPYLDPDLTLTRLARKLGIPAKMLSSTINLATGGNVSRYINQARIKAAQRAMLEGESVTNAMLSSGFNTKSNFNREFLRVVGTSPSKWLASHPMQ